MQNAKVKLEVEVTNDVALRRLKEGFGKPGPDPHCNENTLLHTGETTSSNPNPHTIQDNRPIHVITLY